MIRWSFLVLKITPPFSNRVNIYTHRLVCNLIHQSILRWNISRNHHCSRDHIITICYYCVSRKLLHTQVYMHCIWESLLLPTFVLWMCWCWYSESNSGSLKYDWSWSHMGGATTPTPAPGRTPPFMSVDSNSLRTERSRISRKCDLKQTTQFLKIHILYQFDFILYPGDSQIMFLIIK